MNIYNKEMLQMTPHKSHVIDDVEDRRFEGENGEFVVGCGAIAVSNLLMFYEKEYLRCPTIEALIKEAHFALEEEDDGGLEGNKLLNFLYNEGLTPEISSYPDEYDLLGSVADPLRIALLIFHVGEFTHIQTLRQSSTGRFLLGSLELSLDELKNLTEEKRVYQGLNNEKHSHPSVLIKIKTKKRGG